MEFCDKKVAKLYCVLSCPNVPVSDSKRSQDQDLISGADGHGGEGHLSGRHGRHSLRHVVRDQPLEEYVPHPQRRPVRKNSGYSSVVDCGFI